LAARNVPEIQCCRVGRGINVGVELDQPWMLHKPERMRVAGVQPRIFQHAQTPAVRGRSPAHAVLPVTPVLRVSAQVLPGKSMLIKVQKVEIGRGGTPLLGVAMSHRPTSLLRDSRPWLATEKQRPLCEDQ